VHSAPTTLCFQSSVRRILVIPQATLLVVALLTLAGCSKAPESKNQPAASAQSASPSAPPPAADPAPTADLCTLLTDEEFQQATGFPVLNKKTYATGCDWALKTDTAMPGGHRISADIKTPGGRERFNFMSSGSLKKIPGLGDGAVQTGGNMDGTVWAVTGDTLVTLRYALPVTTADPNLVVLPLLKEILPRL
jgi:hypothetical protein